MQAVILAGGTGTRLYPLDTTVPKPLMPFFDRPVVEHTVKLLAKHGFDDIIITTSYLAKDIARYFGDGSRWGVSIRYSIESRAMGSAGAVRLVKDMITETFAVVSGDLITDIDLRAGLARHRRASGIATILLHHVEDPTPFGSPDTDESGRVSRYVEKPKTADVFTDMVSTGIYILEPEALSSISDNSVQEFATNLFPLLLRNMEPVYAFDMSGYWCDVGDLLQYRNAHFDALQGKLELDLPAVHAGEGIWVGEGVDIDPSAQLSSPIFIGSGARIGRNAVIGSHTVIGAKARVDEGAHVARSVIGGGAFVGAEMRVMDTLVGGGYTVAETDETTKAASVRPERTISKTSRFAQETAA